MLKHIIIAILILSLTSCSVNTDRTIELEGVHFDYLDDAYVFFRNMRQTYYDLEVMDESNWRIYTHEDFTQENLLSMSIVVDWKSNRAYPVLNLPDSIEKTSVAVVVTDNQTGSTTEIQLGAENRQAELVFLTKIYNALIKDEKTYELKLPTKNKQLFDSSDHQDAFRVSLYDFYRLTGHL